MATQVFSFDDFIYFHEDEDTHNIPRIDLRDYDPPEILRPIHLTPTPQFHYDDIQDGFDYQAIDIERTASAYTQQFTQDNNNPTDRTQTQVATPRHNHEPQTERLNIQKQKQEFVAKEDILFDLVPNTTFSTLIPEQLNSTPFNIFLKQTLLPYVLIFIIYLVISRIQMKISDFCYIEHICRCNKVSTKFWSMFHELIIYKIGLIAYKRVIISQFQKQSGKTPIMEMFCLYFFVIACDGVSVIWLELNNQWVFFTYNYIIGFIILLNITRSKDLWSALVQGVGLLLYDLIYIVLICFITYALPAIYERLVRESSFSLVASSYYLLYPILDWLMEWVFDFMVSNAPSAYLFINQIELLIIGLRAGTILNYHYEDFQFWYLVLMVYTRKLNSMTLFLTKFFQRRLVYCVPKAMKPWVTRDTSFAEKARNGGSLENQLWIVVFIYLYYDEKFQVHRLRDTVLIRDCTFQGKNYLNQVTTVSIISMYVVSSFTLLMSFYMNKITKYDNIKWVAGKNFTLFENVVTRLTGYYFFQSSFLFSFLIVKYANTSLVTPNYS